MKTSTYLLLSFCGIVYMFGLFLPIMDVDAAQYAAMSKDMFLSKSYLQVFYHGQDYLDKPPMLFWLSALSFHIFGIHDWAYRLPSVLVSIAGIYAIYRFTKLYYSQSIAENAALITASCQAFFMFHHDVRTDTLLTGFSMLALWQLAEFDLTNKMKHLLFAVAWIAFAMMSKGPVALMLPVFAFGTHYIIRGEWKKFFRWQYIPAIILLAILLFPMCYGLYQQYDLHPEKQVYGLNSPSGIKFFFWTQSFGRITGDNPWNNHPDPLFLVHSFLWSFLPWSLLFIPALFTAFKRRIQAIKLKENAEYISLAGFILIFIILMRSKYQLPHYTFIVHPLASVLLAVYLNGIVKTTTKKIITGIQFFIFIILGVALFFVIYQFFPQYIIRDLVISIAGFFAGIYFLMKEKNTPQQWIFSSVIVICTVNLILNSSIYPQLMQYQGMSVTANITNKLIPKEAKINFYKLKPSCSFDFYSNHPYQNFNQITASTDSIQGDWIITNQDGFDELKDKIKTDTIIPIETYSISVLTLPFLNPKTRTQQVKKIYIEKLKIQ